MAFLYKYECEPNYPVISTAVVIFWSMVTPGDEFSSIQIARSHAKRTGISAWETGKLTYLGSFKPESSEPVVLSISGEY